MRPSPGPEVREDAAAGSGPGYRPGPSPAAGARGAGIDRPGLWAWLTVPILLVTILVLWGVQPSGSFESALLMLGLQLVFSTIASLLVAYFVGRGFIASGAPGLLLLGCGAILWGGAGELAIAVGNGNANVTVTIHNSCAWLSAICNLAGVLLSKRPARVVRSVGVVLPVAYGGAVAAMVFVAEAGSRGMLPTFFVQGQGGTILRQCVLGSAVLLFAIASLVLALDRSARVSAFGRWYCLALALVAVGLLGVFVQSSVGSAINWAGRGAQLLAGLYMVVAAAAAQRQSLVLSTVLEESLRESEGRFRALVELAPDAIVTHQDGRFVYVNGAALQLYGATGPSQLIGVPVLDLVHPDDREIVRERIRQVADGRSSARREIRLKRLDGTFVSVETMATAIEHEGRLATQVIIRDVTDRKEAERVLRETESTLRGILDATRESIWLFDANGVIRLANQTALERLGRPAEQVLGHHFSELIPRELVDRRETHLRQVVESGQPATFEDARAGIAFLHRFYPVTGPDGRVTHVVGFSQDISRQKRAQEEISAANVRLMEADRRKDEFLAVLSHELRNPLAPIQNSLYVLERAAPDSEQARRSWEVLNRQVAHLTRLVDDLLEVNRITTGKMQVRRSPVDLCDLLRRSVEDYRGVFASAGILFDARLPAEPVWIEGDPARLSQAVGNLLHNAAKFTPARGTVRLSAEDDEARGLVAVHVQDTGMGIDPALLAHIFDPFMQADRTLDRSRGGLGLGLALVAGIVRMHDGTVEAASDGPALGARFTIRLPKRRTPPVPSSGAVAAEVPVRSRRVLVIEDMPDAAESVRELLELFGHTVRIARTGTEGLEAFCEFRPDVVLCDIGLPFVDGYDVARRIRAMESGQPRVQLVALTGYGTDDDQRRAAEAGFDAHMTKPVNPDRLRAVLDRR